MSQSRWNDRIVRVVWPLLEASLGRIERQLAARAPFVGCAGCPLPGSASGGISPVPGPVGLVTLTAKGAVAAGDPVMGVPGFPGHGSLLTQDEQGVSNYLGFAANAAADGGALGVVFSGPCSVFLGLGTNPAAPDSLELFVYGPGPPVPASLIPLDSYFRRCGSVITATTVLVSIGDKAFNPA